MKSLKIENRDDLFAEIGRLRELSKVQEEKIRTDVVAIKESLKPVNILKSGIESVTGINFYSENILASGVAAGILLFIRRYVSKVESKAEDVVYEYASKIFNRIRNFIMQYGNSKNQSPEESNNEEEK